MHISFKVGSRGNGQSALAKYDYICREGKYSAKSNELLHKESGNMPEWAKDDSQPYWEAADTYERVNGRLFREVEFALPVELNSEQKIELSREFAREITGKENLPYTIAIHDKKDGNPHCHLVLSERKNDGIDRPIETWFKRPNKKEPECGGATKTRALIPKDWLTQTRERWADIGNDALEKAGYDRELDPRTLKEQGIDRPPGIHLGPHVFEMEEKGILTERGKMALERESLVEQSIELTMQQERYEYERNRTLEEISQIGRAGEQHGALSTEHVIAGRERESSSRSFGRTNGEIERIAKKIPEGLREQERTNPYGEPKSIGEPMGMAGGYSSLDHRFYGILDQVVELAGRAYGAIRIGEKLDSITRKLQHTFSIGQGNDRWQAGVDSRISKEVKQIERDIEQKQQRSRSLEREQERGGYGLEL